MKLFSLALTLVFYFSCSQKVIDHTNEQQMITNIYQGSLTGAGEEGFTKENIVIQNIEDWNSFLTKLNSVNKVSDRFQSAIDFSKKSVIIAIDDVRNTTGFTIKVTEVLPKSKNVEVVVKKQGPKPTDMVGMAITQPIHIITINKTDKKILFVEK